jgi:hypothetical protein
MRNLPPPVFHREMLWLVVLALAVLSAPGAAQPAVTHSVVELLGTWRGTSTCTDKAAAPACRDETVVYDIRRGDKPGDAILAADKVVDDRRVPMGELHFAWDAVAACWRSDFASPNVTSRWCLTTDGATLKGTAILLPGKQIIRRVEVHRITGK